MHVTETLRQVVALRLMKNMGPKAFQNGWTAFGSIGGFFRADSLQWAEIEGLHRLKRSQLEDPRHWALVDREIETAVRHGVEIVSYFDSAYPKLLKEIFDPPILLYVKGRLPADSETWLAMVGSRDASWQGLSLSTSVARELAIGGAVIVSGLARGIDSSAHRGALEAKGLTVAVLGNGLSTVYPPENRKLAKEVAASGALISEFPMDEPPKKENFPMRNRLISGLSRAVLVVEAREKSGALITVDCALEQGRDVYALPGMAGTKKSLGSNELLKEGAKLVTGAEDILRDFGLSRKTGKAAKKRRAPVLNPEEKALMRLLKKAESLHVDQIVGHSTLSPQRTMMLLTTMAIRGIVRELPGKYFAEIER